MKKIRNCRINDKKKFFELWSLSFTDSASFRKWFFENRFIPEYSLCIEEDEKIVSQVQSIPYFLKIRDAIVPSTMMVGACTHPDYTKRGYMKELYTEYMHYVRSQGVVLCAHTPAVLKTYFYVGHFPVSDTAFINIEKASGLNVSGVEPIAMAEEAGALLKCYTKAVQRYSGIALRTFSDMVLKCNDYMADGGQAIAYWKNGEVESYGVYYLTEDSILGEEIVSLTEEGEEKIVDMLINLGAEKKVKIKLPPDTKIDVKQGTLTIAPRNVLGLANAPALLRLVGKNMDYAIEVADHVVKENNGVFNLKGEKTQENPCFKIEAGNLVQWLVGYKTLANLQEEKLIEVYDKAKLSELDVLFPKQLCHIIDEY